MRPPSRIVRRHAASRDAGHDTVSVLLVLAFVVSVALWAGKGLSRLCCSPPDRLEWTVWTLPATLVAGAGIAALHRWSTRPWALACRVVLGVAVDVLVAICFGLVRL